MKRRRFLVLWVLAVAATTSAFVLHLALRGRIVDVGYRLGKARSEQARLREVERVLKLEAASHQTPQRVEMVARQLLHMTSPPAERVIPLRPIRARKKATKAGKSKAPTPARKRVSSEGPANPGGGRR